jgi:ankyrin repeat protein
LIVKTALQSAIEKSQFGKDSNSKNWRVSLMLIEAGSSLDRGKVPPGLCTFAATSTTVIQALVGRGIIIRDLRRDDLRTPLHVAAERSRHEADDAVLKMLISLCDLEARDSFQNTCTHIAAWFRNTRALRCFISAGASVNCRNVDNATPLHATSTSQCTVLLLAAGANVNISDRYGNTPLHCSLIGQHQDAMSMLHALLAAGADLDAVDRQGATVRQLLAGRQLVVDADNVESAKRLISKVRLDFVRDRALQVCIGLQSRGLDALQMCEILLFACGPVAPVVAFHHWWKIATTVKHFHKK